MTATTKIRVVTVIAIAMLAAPYGTAADQEFAGREKLRAHSREFRKEVIKVTHGHPEHTGGATVFAGNDNPDIYSHRLLVEGAPEIARGKRDGRLGCPARTRQVRSGTRCTLVTACSTC